jgi:1-deoxy-D-xylulose-5-phosphate reductoisomerase
MSHVGDDFKVDDGFNILSLRVKEADKDGSLQGIASTFDPVDQIIRDGLYEGGRKVISFAGVLKYDMFPLPKILQLAQQYHTPILPVDSEHSAIFQSLVGEDDNPIEKILLTASGGPFRNFTMEQLETVTKADALRHPTWDMGAKITIDSASMMNKGFEVIEAKWLFGVDARQIQVLVHPQSIVHSAVQFHDGAVKAQLGVPDMRLPIQYAFSFPQRLPLSGDRLDFFAQKLEFFEPDLKKFRCLALAFEAIEKGGNMPCIVNAANEIVNRGFLEDRCRFLQMSDIIAETMQRCTFSKNPDYDVYIQTDAEARRIAEAMLKS